MGTKTPAYSIRFIIEYRVKDARYLKSIIKNFCVPNPDIITAQPIWILPRALFGSLFSLEVTRPHNNATIQYQFRYVQMRKNLLVPTIIEDRITLEIDAMVIEQYVNNTIQDFMKPFSKHKDTTFRLDQMIPVDFLMQDFLIEFVSHGIDVNSWAVTYKAFGNRKNILTNTNSEIITMKSDE